MHHAVKRANKVFTILRIRESFEKRRCRCFPFPFFYSVPLAALQCCSAIIDYWKISGYFNKPQTYSTTPDAMGCGIVIVILTWSNYSNVGLTWSEMETKTGSVEHWVRRKTWGNLKFISASSTKTLIDLPELFHLIISQTQETADT